MLVQLLDDDPALELVPATATDALSGREFPREMIETLMQRLFALLASRCELAQDPAPRSAR
jgi:hypothetical protein